MKDGKPLTLGSYALGNSTLSNTPGFLFLFFLFLCWLSVGSILFQRNRNDKGIVLNCYPKSTHFQGPSNSEAEERQRFGKEQKPQLLLMELTLRWRSTKTTAWWGWCSFVWRKDRRGIFGLWRMQEWRVEGYKDVLYFERYLLLMWSIAELQENAHTILNPEVPDSQALMWHVK